MIKLIKLCLVLGGYVAACYLASAAVDIRVAQTSGPAAQASAGMYAFGDFMWFAGAFGLLALIPTGLALIFLRPLPRVWTGLSVAAVIVAATGLLGVALVIVMPLVTSFAANQIPILYLPVTVGFFRVLASPLLTIADLACLFIAPTPLTRQRLVLATILEGAVSVYAVLRFLMPFTP